MNLRIIDSLDKNRGNILKVWQSTLDTRLLTMGIRLSGSAPSVIEESYNFILIQMKGLENAEIPDQRLHELFGKGVHPKLIHYIEVFLVGEEVIYEYLLTGYENLDQTAWYELNDFVDDLGLAFDALIQACSKGVCTHCAVPVEEAHEQLIRLELKSHSSSQSMNH